MAVSLDPVLQVAELGQSFAIGKKLQVKRAALLKPQRIDLRADHSSRSFYPTRARRERAIPMSCYHITKPLANDGRRLPGIRDGDGSLGDIR
ncbi:hypothetical protein [Rhizobium leguminosarum]